jgi:hypothetical protein
MIDSMKTRLSFGAFRASVQGLGEIPDRLDDERSGVRVVMK